MSEKQLERIEYYIAFWANLILASVYKNHVLAGVALALSMLSFILHIYVKNK